MSNVIKLETDLPEVKAPVEIRFDPENLSYAELKTLNDLNMFERIPLIEKCITGWGYDNKFEKGALRKLGLAKAGNVIRVVMEGIADDILEAAKHVEVDFDRAGWSIENLEKISDLDEAKKYDKLGETFLEVCSFPGGNPKTPLNAVDGGAGYNAIMEKWSKILSGKN